MYGKLFAQMYDGSLYGKWQALVTFQQMVVLCDSDGVVDMTPQALAARTSIPLEIIHQGIADLEQPDPQARFPAYEGRAVVRLSPLRAWGWRIVYPIDFHFRRPPLPAGWRSQILERDEFRCVFCGNGDHLEIDHIYPWSLGGRHDYANLNAAANRFGSPSHPAQRRGYVRRQSLRNASRAKTSTRTESGTLCGGCNRRKGAALL